MEYIFDKPLKITGFYRCPDDINCFKIRIRIKQGLPNDAAGRKPEKCAEKEFRWQQKSFSKSEKQLYKEERNCFTEREKEYHRLIMEEEISDEREREDFGFLFSLVNEDDAAELLSESDEDFPERGVKYLENQLSALSLNPSRDDNGYNFLDSLQKAIDRPVEKNEWQIMHLMADFGEYFGDAWLKEEKVLCTLKYDAQSKILQVFPDFTVDNPYFLRTRNERTFHYFIENRSACMPESIETNERVLLRKIREREAAQKASSIPTTFQTPPINKFHVYVFMEIAVGQRFEYPEVHVKYTIRLPEGWTCSDPDVLVGRTQVGRAAHPEGLLHFGHCLDLALELHLSRLSQNELPKRPRVYFEVISKDSWDRYRTEGLSHVALPVSRGGKFTYDLHCFRFTSRHPTGEMRRFFIGDCENYTDVTWIGIPDGYNEPTINKLGAETIPTGMLRVRFDVVQQSQEFLDKGEGRRRAIFETLGSSTLIKSVQQVIREFKRARKEMLEARKDV